MSSSKYPVCENSGKYMLKEHPGHWNLTRLRFICKINPNFENNFDNETTVSFLPMEKIKENGGLNLDIEKAIYEVKKSYTFFANSDVLIAKITPCFENGKGSLCSNLTNGIGFGTTELHVLRPSINILPGFLFYLTISYPFRQYGGAEMYGAGGQKRVPEEFIKNFVAAIPPIEEQKRIAHFLEYKTNQIDSLIGKKEQLLKLLAEKRIALITQAVTGKLYNKIFRNFNKKKYFKWKSSGIEWLGIIPAHWEIKRLKFISHIATGSKDTVNREDDAEYPFYVRSDIIERISTYSFDGEAILTAGDGVGAAKVFHYVNGKFDYHQRVYKISNFKGIYGKFLFYYMKENFQKEVLKDSVNTTVDSLRRPMFLNFPVLVPPFEEQKIIVEYLNLELDSIESLYKIIERNISGLKEYRTSLITSAVTGKIDVRNWSPQMEKEDEIFTAVEDNLK